jgi:hypothetical protein
VAYLRTLYRYLNETRFDGLLPGALPVRLSSRMGTSLGHMWPADDEGTERSVVEIALNVDLMLEGNGAERFDTLLHEMAHVADYLLTGHRGHGKSWRDWARRVGCRPERLYRRPVRRRRSRRTAVTRVPPLPPALASPLETESPHTDIATLDSAWEPRKATASGRRGSACHGQSQPNAPAVSKA